MCIVSDRVKCYYYMLTVSTLSPHILNTRETFWLSISFFTSRLRFPNFLDSSDTLSMEGYFVVLSGMIFHLRWVIPVSRILFLKNILCILFAHSFQQPLLWFLAVRLYVIYLDRHWHILLCLSLHVHPLNLLKYDRSTSAEIFLLDLLLHLTMFHIIRFKDPRYFH